MLARSPEIPCDSTELPMVVEPVKQDGLGRLSECSIDCSGTSGLDSDREDSQECRLEGADALCFEMSEALDNDAVDDSRYGLDIDALAEIISKDGAISGPLNYELTDDLRPEETEWQDSQFGFSDQQVELLRKTSTEGMASIAEFDPDDFGTRWRAEMMYKAMVRQESI